MLVDFKQQLRRQLGFLRNSAFAFDCGLRDEGIRMSTSIRVLIHNTPKSTSLLKHLNATTIDLLSTVKGASDRTLFYMGMGTVRVSGDGSPEYYPALGDSIHSEFVPVSKWWDQIVFVDPRLRLSRRKIVLAAANRDGGAHVDRALDNEYAELTQGLMFVTHTRAGQPERAEPLQDTHLVSLRQMAYELLNSPSLVSRAEA